MIKIYFIP